MSRCTTTVKSTHKRCHTRNRQLRGEKDGSDSSDDSWEEKRKKHRIQDLQRAIAMNSTILENLSDLLGYKNAPGTYYDDVIFYNKNIAKPSGLFQVKAVSNLSGAVSRGGFFGRIYEITKGSYRWTEDASSCFTHFPFYFIKKDYTSRRYLLDDSASMLFTLGKKKLADSKAVWHHTNVEDFKLVGLVLRNDKDFVRSAYAILLNSIHDTAKHNSSSTSASSLHVLRIKDGLGVLQHAGPDVRDNGIFVRGIIDKFKQKLDSILNDKQMKSISKTIAKRVIHLAVKRILDEGIGSELSLNQEFKGEVYHKFPQLPRR